MGAHERSAFARAMAERVVAAAGPLPVAVVCDDTGVAAWARSLGALVVWEPGRGLNGAVEAGVDHLVGIGVTQVTVAHADLPRAADLAQVGDAEGITLVADRFRNGTNVIVVPGRAGFRFSYGPGSFSRHVLEAERLGLPYRILDRPDLAWDVDEPDDLIPVRSPGLQHS
jgi:2-phospho-L-lactate guanylyltransferase